MRKKRQALCAACAAVLGLARTVTATDYFSTWTTTAGSWSSATNWNNAPPITAYPNNGDDTGDGNTYEVTVNGTGTGATELTLTENITVSSLSFPNADLIGSASTTTGTATGPSLTVLGNFNNGNAGSFRLNAGAILNLAGADTIAGFCNVDGDSNTAVNIMAGGTLTVNTNYLNTFYNPMVTVAGEVDVNQGTFQIDTGGTHSGTFNVASNATASINGAFSSTATVNNSGLFQIITSAGSDSDPTFPGETGHNFNGSLTVQPNATLGITGIGLPFGVQYFTNQSTVTLGPSTTLTTASGTDVAFNNQQALNIGTANFGGGEVFRNPGLTIGVATLSTGILQFQNTGTVTIGTLNQTAAGQNILRTGGEVNLPTTVSVGTFNLSGGAESGAVSVTGAMNWTGGVINADYGHVTIQPGASLTIGVGAGSITQSGRLDVSGQTFAAGDIIDTGGTNASSVVNFNIGTTTVTGNLDGANTGTLTGASNTPQVRSNFATPAVVGAVEVTFNVASAATVIAKEILLGNTSGGDAELNNAGVVQANGISLNDVTVTAGTLSASTDTNSADNLDPVLNGSIVGGYLRDGQLNNNGGYVSAPYIKLGVSSGNTGTFTQTSGSGSIGILGAGNSGTLTSGSGAGVVNVSGGSLYANTILLGDTNNGSGAMTVSGTASVTIGGGAHFNDMTVNAGTVTVLDQAPPAGEDPELNRALVGGYMSNGALNVNGGDVTSPFIKLGITQGFTGTFDQTGGTVNVGVFGVGNDGTLTSGSGTGIANVSGGSLYVTTLLLGDTNDGSGQMTVSGDAILTIGGGAHFNDLTFEPGTVTTVLDQDPPVTDPPEDPELNRALVGGYLSNGALNAFGGTVTTPYIKLGLTQGYTGTFSQTAGTVNVGTLCVGDDVVTTSGSGVGSTIISGGTLLIGTLLIGSNAKNAGVGTVSISGTADVRVTSAITMIAGQSTLNVSGGSLTLDGAAASLASNVIPIGDGTQTTMLHLHNSSLAGSGASLTVAAHATVDGGGGDLAGETVGSVSLSSVSLSLSSGATLHMAIGGAPTNADSTSNAGVTFDQIAETGGVFTAGGATLEILPLSGVVLGKPYPIVISSSNGIDSSIFSGMTVDPSYPDATSYTVAYSSSEIDVTFSAVPEPSSAMLLALGGLLLRRRRHS